jgi:hypothetical protein
LAFKNGNPGNDVKLKVFSKSIFEKYFPDGKNTFIKYFENTKIKYFIKVF